MKTLRIVLAVVLALAAAMFAYVTLTVPTFAATAPALITIALVAATWFVYPRRRLTPEGGNR